MKIIDLITELKKQDPEMHIILAQDQEGNGYSSLVDLGYAYVEKGTANDWDPDVWDEDGMEEMRKEDGDEYVDHNFEKVLVIWP